MCYTRAESSFWDDEFATVRNLLAVPEAARRF